MSPGKVRSVMLSPFRKATPVVIAVHHTIDTLAAPQPFEGPSRIEVFWDGPSPACSRTSIEMRECPELDARAIRYASIALHPLDLLIAVSCVKNSG